MDAEKKSSVGTKSDFAPKAASKPQAESSDYAHARAARKPGGSFMGVEASEDRGKELKSAQEQHDTNVKALDQ
jgi:hypothetical protein